MQNRDYDCYIEVPSIIGFRQLDDSFLSIIPNQETNGYTNMYADGIAVSYLHDMEEQQLNAIHFFEDNQITIINVLTQYLSKTFQNPRMELGLASINILNEFRDGICFVSYKFLDASGNKIVVKLHKDNVV